MTDHESRMVNKCSNDLFYLFPYDGLENAGKNIFAHENCLALATELDIQLTNFQIED